MKFRLPPFCKTQTTTLLRVHTARFPSVSSLPFSTISLAEAFPSSRAAVPSSRPVFSPFTWEPFNQLSSLFGLRELLESILWAVPKKKTSHSKKGMRLSNKGLKNITSIETCPACERPKRMHHLCLYCYRQLKYQFKGGGRTGV